MASFFSSSTAFLVVTCGVISGKYIGLDTKVPFFWVCDQERFNPASLSSEDHVACASDRVAQSVTCPGLESPILTLSHTFMEIDHEIIFTLSPPFPFTVRHILLECDDFAQVRNNCFHVLNMKQLFQDIHIDSIMTFLRQINLFNKF